MKRWGFLCLMVLLSCGVAGTLYLRSHYGLPAASFGAGWNVGSDSPSEWHGQASPRGSSQEGLSVHSLRTELTSGDTETVEAEKQREHTPHQQYKKHAVLYEPGLEENEVNSHAENTEHKAPKQMGEFEGYKEVKKTREAKERKPEPTVQQAQAKDPYYLPQVVKGFYYRNAPNGWNAATSVILCLGAAVLILTMVLSTVDRRGAGSRNRAVPEIYVGEETGEEFVIPYVSIAYM